MLLGEVIDKLERTKVSKGVENPGYDDQLEEISQSSVQIGVRSKIYSKVT